LLFYVSTTTTYTNMATVFHYSTQRVEERKRQCKSIQATPQPQAYGALSLSLMVESRSWLGGE